MPNDSHRPDVAVFIDFENVYVSVRDKLDANPNFEAIMDRCQDLGRVVIARAYADWYRYPRVTSALYANAIEPMYVPTYYYDRDMGRTGRPIKNSVDMNLCVDAMKTLYTNPNIKKFVLATGDRDFIPLVNTIRQQGKEVIVIGIGGAASTHLAQSADEFIFYETLVGRKAGASTIDDVPRAKMPEKGREYESEESSSAAAPRREREREYTRSEASYSNGSSNGNAASAATPAPVQPAASTVPPPAPEPAQPDIYDTLVRAINLARERGYVCSFGSLKLLMKELMGGDFKESRYKDAQNRPFAKFKDFVMEAERRGKVQVFTNGTVNEVFLPGEDPYKLSQFAADLKVDTDVAPVISETIEEPRSEGRPSVSSAGRRRRRRRRPGERSNGDSGFDIQDEELEAEEIELDAIAAPDQSVELMDESEANEIFEELLEQVTEEDATSLTLAELEPAEILDPETSEIESLEEFESPVEFEVPTETIEEPAETLAPSEDAGEPIGTAEPVSSRSFDESDWQFIRDVMTEHGRPVSFAQLHDLLRNARNRLSVPRTNEELRSLAKQAINTSFLLRQGKGSRVSYRLAEATNDAENDVIAQLESLEAPETEQPAQEAEIVPEADNSQTATLEVAETAPVESTGSAVLDGLNDAAQLADDPVQAQAEVAELQDEITAIALEPDSEVSGVAAIEPEAAPKRRRRRKTEEDAPAAEAVAETSAAEEAAPRRRTRRRKADTTEE